MKIKIPTFGTELIFHVNTFANFTNFILQYNSLIYLDVIAKLLYYLIN